MLGLREIVLHEIPIVNVDCRSSFTVEYCIWWRVMLSIVHGGKKDEDT